MIWSPSSQTFAEETRGDLGVKAENGSRIWFQFSAVPQAPHMTLGIFLNFLQMLGNISPASFRWGVVWAGSSADDHVQLSLSFVSWWAWMFLSCVWRMLSHPSVTEAALWACHCLFPQVKQGKAFCDSLLMPCFSLSVTFPYKLNSAGSQERSLLFLCATLTGWTLFTDLW